MASWRRIVEDIVAKKVHDVGHEVVLGRVLLIVDGQIESVSKYLDHVCSVSCRDEVEWTLEVFNKFVRALRRAGVQINFVGDYYEGNVRRVVPHFVVPNLQIIVSDLASGVKHHDTGMGAIVVAGV